MSTQIYTSSVREVRGKEANRKQVACTEGGKKMTSELSMAMLNNIFLFPLLLQHKEEVFCH
jgi:hypothetical protein